MEERQDLISRQAAIDAIGEKPFAGTGDEYDYEQGLQNQWERDVVAIKILPSAQSEPYIDSIVSEIEKTISETREICFGLQLALEIIEEKRNGRSDIQTGGD